MPPARIHHFERQERRGRRLAAVATLVIVALLSASWVGLFSFLSVSAAYGTFTDLDRRYLPDVQGMDLTLPDISRLSRVYTKEGVVLAELHAGRNSEPVRLKDVPKVVRQAILAAEDSDFYEHEGIDFQSIMRAAVSNVQGNARQGGSTITQQVVKQNFVGSEQTIERKISEAVLAAELERRYTKDEILQFYLNSVYFGSGAYGVKAAAWEFFDKPLKDVSLAEAATLATLIRNPGLYDPRSGKERALLRRNQVLDAMVVNNFVTRREADGAKEAPLETVPHSEFQGPADHVVAEVKRQLLHEPEFAFLGPTYEERKRAIFGCEASDTKCTGGGGLKITVSIDLALQQEANRIINEWLPQPEEGEAPTGAIASVDNQTGAVLVMASGLPFDAEQFDLATQGRRQAGSAFKPFTLVAALESGITLGSYWDSSSPQEIECAFPCAPDGSLVWTVHNANRTGYGLIPLLEATKNSVNAVYAQVAVDVGPAKIVEVAHRMGIQSQLPEVYSLTLGTGSTSPLEMASAFSNFATNGLHAKPYIVERIENAAGEVIYEHQPSQQQVLDPTIAAAARGALEEAVCCGTGTRAQLGRPQFGKTGTHQNFNDAWFLGGVPQITTAVWVGFPDAQKPLRDLVIHGEYYSRVYGGSVPAPMWKEFMDIALAGVPVAQFPPTPAEAGELFVTPEAEVPDVVGLSSSDAAKQVLDAHLRPVRQVVASFQPEGLVVSQSPAGGQMVQQGTSVAIRVSSGRPPSAPLPDLRGKTVAEADATLQQLAAQTGVVIGYWVQPQEVGDPNLVHRVLATEPAPGTEMAHGASVNLVVGKAKPPPPKKDPPDKKPPKPKP
ncbi:MAG: transglycosylase domain-containing protein [Actinomycetota bacterium]|nr:transglycosylase domain-containing protein [Actinomycetota bacterium]